MLNPLRCNKKVHFGHVDLSEHSHSAQSTHSTHTTLTIKELTNLQQYTQYLNNQRINNLPVKEVPRFVGMSSPLGPTCMEPIGMYVIFIFPFFFLTAVDLNIYSYDKYFHIFQLIVNIFLPTLHWKIKCLKVIHVTMDKYTF